MTARISIRMPIIFVFLLISAPLVSASPGLFHAFVYEMQARDINQDLVRNCTSSFPVLGPRGTVSLAKWTQRNATKALRASASFADEMRVHASSPKEIEALQTAIAQTRKDIAFEYASRLAKEGVRACHAIFLDLETGTGGVDLL